MRAEQQLLPNRELESQFLIELSNFVWRLADYQAILAQAMNANHTARTRLFQLRSKPNEKFWIHPVIINGQVNPIALAVDLDFAPRDTSFNINEISKLCCVHRASGQSRKILCDRNIGAMVFNRFGIKVPYVVGVGRCRREIVAEPFFVAEFAKYEFDIRLVARRRRFIRTQANAVLGQRLNDLGSIPFFLPNRLNIC